MECMQNHGMYAELWNVFGTMECKSKVFMRNASKEQGFSEKFFNKCCRERERIILAARSVILYIIIYYSMNTLNS